MCQSETRACHTCLRNATRKELLLHVQDAFVVYVLYGAGDMRDDICFSLRATRYTLQHTGKCNPIWG